MDPRKQRRNAVRRAPAAAKQIGEWEREARRMAQSLDPDDRLWRFYADQLDLARKHDLADALHHLVVATLHPTVNGRALRKPSIPQKLQAVNSE